MEEQIVPASKDTANAFEDIEFPLNNNQRAVAAVAFLNEERCKRQIHIVPAGKGKSRIHAGITHMFLKH